MLNHTEKYRLEKEGTRRPDANWKRWGPYLAERQWGTVREDYSADGRPWEHFPHDQARSRAYRWGEDGLLGFCDRQCRLCFSPVLWNGRDPILKERLFGLSGPEGNHGEDVKESYFYLDATPTYSYAKALYKYPQERFPYDDLVAENARRDASEPEYEIEHTGIFSEGRYFDVFVEYAKSAPEDLLIKISVHNRGPESAALHLLPTLWLRNTWNSGSSHEHAWPKPRLFRSGESVYVEHFSLGHFFLYAEDEQRRPPQWLFTDNETRHPGDATPRYGKDAFHRYLIDSDIKASNPREEGSKAAALFQSKVPAGEAHIFRLRLVRREGRPHSPFDTSFDAVIEKRRREADQHYALILPSRLDAEEQSIARQAYAGLLWSKQFYHYVVDEWRKDSTDKERNRDWSHLFNRDLISMPDKWEYP